MSRMNRSILDGAGAGVVAALLMGVAMVGAEKYGLLGDKAPPRKLVTNFLPKTAGTEPATAHQEQALASVAHVGYGAAVGAGYALARRYVPAGVPEPVAGMAYGALVYAVTYQGWIPALDLIAPPRHHFPLRPPTMMLLHLVYGAALGVTWERLERRHILPSRRSVRKARARIAEGH